MKNYLNKPNMHLRFLLFFSSLFLLGYSAYELTLLQPVVIVDFCELSLNCLFSQFSQLNLAGLFPPIIHLTLASVLMDYASLFLKDRENNNKATSDKSDFPLWFLFLLLIISIFLLLKAYI